MTGWTPLFQQIIGSSVWSAPNHVRIAWVTMLAVADKNGICALTVGGLSALARISREDAENAFDVLSSPDADTLTQANEGRRIERVPGGWRLLNWEAYREKAKRAIIQEHNRDAQARWRDKQKEQTDAPAVNGEKYHEDAADVLELINKISGKDFRKTDSNLSAISVRLEEDGVDFGGMVKMLKRQWELWKDSFTTDNKPMREYFQPSTLFRKSKFDGYYANRDLEITKPPPKNLPEQNQIQEKIEVRSL